MILLSKIHHLGYALIIFAFRGHWLGVGAHVAMAEFALVPRFVPGSFWCESASDAEN